jgi:hypothetical protein
MNLVDLTKRQLKEVLEKEWKEILDQTKAFCKIFSIETPDMDANYQRTERRVFRRFMQESVVSNDHFYRYQVFYSIIDVILSELNHRFPSIVTDLLNCTTAFDPRGNFLKYDEDKLKKLATFYAADFNE